MAKKRTFETATNTYSEQGLLGEGGAGCVFKVADEDGESYALKLLREAATSKRKRFKNELHFCRKNTHNRIVKVVDEGVLIEDEKRMPFYVMPLYPSTLRNQMSKGKVADVLSLFGAILDGVEAAHLQGVFHRDLKPENILIDESSQNPIIADFGIAHFAEDDLATLVETKEGEKLANFVYAAPEQRVRGNKIDHRADIYALGLILNELFTGQVPQGTGHLSINGVDPRFGYLDPIVERMIRQDAQERYPSIYAVKEAISVAGKQFLVQQRLDQVRNEVVPVFTPEDPLGGVEVRVGSFSYKSGQLHFQFTPAPPAIWLQVLHNLGSYGFTLDGAVPSRVEMLDLEAGKAMVSANSNSVDQVGRFVREWTASANTEYSSLLAAQAIAKEKQVLEGIEAKRKLLEEEAKGMAKLKEAGLS